MHASNVPVGIRKVFIVDDHPTVRDGLSMHLTSQADLCVCGEADDVESALLGIASAEPDIVVIDMGLKNSSGLELIKRLHDEKPDLAVLAWSMHDASLFAQRALNAGALGYISKMRPTAEVVDAIRHALAREPAISDTSGATGRQSRVKPVGPGRVEDLSDRELQVFQMLGEGLNMAQMTARTQLSAKTIETYRARIKQKLELATHSELMRCAVQWALERRIPTF